MHLTVTSKPLYVVLLAAILADILLLGVSRATLDLTNLSDLGFSLARILAFAMLFFSLSRASVKPGRALLSLKYFAEAAMFFSLVLLALPLLNHLTMMIPFPYQDDFLSRLDRAIAFDWLGYFELVHSSPTAIAILEFCYVQLSNVGLMALVALAVIGDPRRMRFYIEVFFYTGAFAIVAGAAFPALAAVNHYVADLSAYPNFANPPGVYHLPYMEMLRDPARQVALNPVGLPGLITFPSYHTASGILLCVAFFRTWLFVPATIYSMLMIASSPVFGAHYLIDIIAGVVLAVVAIWYFLRRPRNRGLFARKSQADTTVPQLA